jgi:hypothetical protein
MSAWTDRGHLNRTSRIFQAKNRKKEHHLTFLSRQRLPCVLAVWSLVYYNTLSFKDSLDQWLRNYDLYEKTSFEVDSWISFVLSQRLPPVWL